MFFGDYPTVVVPSERVCDVCGETAPVERFSPLTPTVCLDCPDEEYWSVELDNRERVYAEGNLPRNVLSLLIEKYAHCLACGSTDNLSVDHVVPISKGGRHVWDNVQLLCKSCNSKKGNRSETDYRPS